MTRPRQRTRRRSSSGAPQISPTIANFRFRTLRNNLPPAEFLGPAQIEELHNASMRIIEEIGLDFFDDEVIDLWVEAGAKVDRVTRHVWFEREMILDLVAKAPTTFTWHARNPERNVEIGENSVAFAPMGGMVYVSHGGMKRQTGRFQHIEELTKLNQMCNMIHMGGGGVAPNDVPVSFRHLRRAFASYTLSDKTVYGSTHGRIIPVDMLKMAEIVFRGQERDGPVMSGVINVNSPLRFDKRMLGGLLTMSRAGQAIIMTPFILAGAMSPITMAAAIAQQNAEALVGVALTQLVNPGSPVVYGGFTTNTDMRTGSPAFGTPEGAWAMQIGAQLARRYQLPYRGSGSLCSTNTVDAQAAYQTMWTMWPTVMAHTNLVNHSIGWLENGLTVNYEKFILDVEALGMFYHYLEGFEINEETLAFDMMKEVGPGGHHFGTAHTQARYSTEFYDSIFGPQAVYETWAANGEEDVMVRAHKIWKTLLRNYEKPPLDQAIEDELAEFIARRERELEGVDLYQDDG